MKKRLLFWFIYGLLLIGVTAFGTEVVASFLVPPWPARDIRPVTAEAMRSSYAEALAEQPELIPVYNDWALRDRPRTFARPDKVRFRSVMVGDSFLEGVFVRVTVSAQIERLWAAQGKDDMEAINFGVRATGPRQYYYRIRDVALRLKPDAIVLNVYAGNDFISEPYKPWSLPPAIAELPVPSVLGAVMPRTTWLAVNRLRLSELGRGGPGVAGEFGDLNRWIQLPPEERLDRFVDHLRAHYFPKVDAATLREILSRGNGRLWTIFDRRPLDRAYLQGWLLGGMVDWETGTWTMARDLADAERMAGEATIQETLSWIVAAQQLARDNGIRFFVAMIPVGTVDPDYVAFWKTWPNYFSYNFWAEARHRKLVAALRANGVPTVDLAEDLDGVPGTYRIDDGHWNERGTELVAARLSRELLGLRASR